MHPIKLQTNENPNIEVYYESQRTIRDTRVGIKSFRIRRNTRKLIFTKKSSFESKLNLIKLVLFKSIPLYLMQSFETNSSHFSH